jgi:hypothetical protein
MPTCRYFALKNSTPVSRRPNLSRKVISTIKPVTNVSPVRVANRTGIFSIDAHFNPVLSDGVSVSAAIPIFSVEGKRIVSQSAD